MLAGKRAPFWCSFPLSTPIDRERSPAMARQRTSASWFRTFRGLFGSQKENCRKNCIRRLGAELLENRMVLSTAPLADAAGQSLADYLADEHEMGPVAPAEIAAADDNALAGN